MLPLLHCNTCIFFPHSAIAPNDSKQDYLRNELDEVLYSVLRDRHFGYRSLLKKEQIVESGCGERLGENGGSGVWSDKLAGVVWAEDK